MKQQWLAWAARFDALSRRERTMVGAAVLAGICLIGYSLLIEPQLLRSGVEAKRVAVARTELAELVGQVAQMQTQIKDPDAENRAALQQTRQRMATIDSGLQKLESSLVSPGQMPGFLESLLSRNRRLELVGLRTLPALNVIDRPEEKKADRASPANIPTLYKHGVEIRIAGSYNDLLAYLAELERMPQRILWNQVSLKVDQYPRSVLTLTVYTLSLDKQWLIV